jgi:hypothetical protein
MHEPKIANYITGWTLYQFDKEVAIQNQLFFVQDSFRHLDVAEWVKFIPPHHRTNEDGQVISEWKTDLASIQEFYETLH